MAAKKEILEFDVKFRLSITWAMCVFVLKLKRFSSLPEDFDPGHMV